MKNKYGKAYFRRGFAATLALTAALGMGVVAYADEPSAAPGAGTEAPADGQMPGGTGGEVGGNGGGQDATISDVAIDSSIFTLDDKTGLYKAVDVTKVETETKVDYTTGENVTTYKVYYDDAKYFNAYQTLTRSDGTTSEVSPYTYIATKDAATTIVSAKDLVGKTIGSTGDYDSVKVVPAYKQALLGSFTARAAEVYRSMYFINSDYSVDTASIGQYVDKTAPTTGYATDGSRQFTLASNITATDDAFNAIVVQGSEDENATATALTLNLSDKTIDLTSKSDGDNTACDFNGWGSAIAVFDKADVAIKGGTINTVGVGRTAVFVDDGADVVMDGTKIIVDGTTAYSGYKCTADQTKMVNPPWVLGISGYARATNLMGNYSTFTVLNSDVTSKQWGVLSTDACSQVVLNVINSKMTMTTDSKTTVGDGSGVDGIGDNDSTATANWNDASLTGKATGYGTYAIGGAVENFYGVTANVSTYMTICANGSNVLKFSSVAAVKDKDDNITLQKYVVTGQDANGNDVTELKDTTNKVSVAGSNETKTTVNSDNFGVMVWGGADITVEEGTTFNTGDATFLIRSGAGTFSGATIKVSDSSINAANGVLLQMLDNEDEAGEGVAVPSGYSGPVFDDVKFNETIDETEYIADRANTNSGKSADITLTATADGKTTATPYAGDILNGSGYKLAASDLNVEIVGGKNTTEYNTKGELDSTKDNVVTYTGLISATTIAHDAKGLTETPDATTKTKKVTIGEDQFWALGHVKNAAYYNGYNNVSVTVGASAKWDVTPQSAAARNTSLTDYAVVTSLTVTSDLSEKDFENKSASEKTKMLQAEAAGKLLAGDKYNDGTNPQVQIYVDGVLTTVEAGKTYTGTILIPVKGKSIDSIATSITALDDASVTSPVAASYAYGETATDLTAAGAYIKSAATVLGTFSYQWYVADSATEAGTAIKGATTDTLSVDTLQSGTKYYYAVIKNSLAFNDKGELADSVKVSTTTTQKQAYEQLTKLKATVPSGIESASDTALTDAQVTTVNALITAAYTSQTKYAKVTVAEFTAPTAGVSEDVTTEVGKAATLTATATSANKNTTFSYVWYNAATDAIVGAGETINVTPTEVGETSYYVIVTEKDVNGLTKTSEKSASVKVTATEAGTGTEQPGEQPGTDNPSTPGTDNPSTPGTDNPSTPGTDATTLTVAATSVSKTWGDASFSLGATSNAAITYATSNAKVATVDADGNVTLVSTGKATITVTAGDKTETVAITVKPKKASVKSVKSSAKKQVKVTVAKLAKVKGYQVQVSTSKKFTKATTKSVKSTKVTTTIKKLKSGKKYYVRVRGYKAGVNGAWSAIKTVTVK
jgi:hypothetical protein